MAQHNNFKKDMNLLSEAYSQICKESREYVEKRGDGYTVKYIEELLDDDIHVFATIHTPTGEKVDAAEKEIDEIIDYHKEHGEFPASHYGVVRSPSYKPVDLTKKPTS